MLKIFESLDRFELLYPDNANIRDLRRAYIDRDLTSIFKLVTTENKEDLRKLVLEDNIWKLWTLLENYADTQFVAAFKNFVVNNIEIEKDCFSRGQLQSKIWLIRELENCNIDLGTVYLCAGWYSTLATMLFESKIKVDKVRSFDIDPSCADIAEVFNKPWFVDNWKFKAITKDIMHITYDEYQWESWSNANNRMSKPVYDRPDTIINTSCEHLPDFIGWYNKIPVGKLVILQANDYHEVKEHINTYNTLEEFSASASMSTVLYEGKLKLSKYTRFMKIGYK